MDLRQVITKNIATIVRSSSKTQMQIASEMGVSNQTITDYVLGNSVPTVFTLVKLCQVLDCNYDDILGNL